MPKIIPAFFDDGNLSPGEKRLFKSFSNDKLMNNWIIFHSLKISKHAHQRTGELDFLFIIPNVGMLCLEVKSHHTISFDEDYWYYGKKEEKGKSPFDQVEGNMQSIRAYIKNRNPQLRGLLLHTAVFFTDWTLKEKSIEWDNVPTLNKKDYLECYDTSFAKKILDILQKGHKESQKIYDWYSIDKCKPSREQTSDLTHIIKPKFYPPLECFDYNHLVENENQIKRYTNEQCDALDRLKRNKKILITGYAGTGKTYLALKAIKDSTAQKKKTLFLCFNRNLSAWLEKVIDLDASKGLIKREYLEQATFHKFLGSHIPEVEGNKKVKIRELITEFIDAYANNRTTKITKYDYVVIDEVQDFLNFKGVFGVLNLFIKDGFSDGNWLFLGDVQKQVLYGDINALDEQKIKIIEDLSDSDITFYELTKNCRNQKRLAETIEWISNLKPPYTSYLIDDLGEDHFSLKTYEDKKDQNRQVMRLLDTLKRRHNKENIILLSPIKNSCGKALSKKYQKKYYEYGEELKYQSQGIAYSTIHSFKGLERAIVILTDFDTVNSDRDRALIYVGLSRAKLKAYFFCQTKAKSHFQQALRNYQGI